MMGTLTNMSTDGCIFREIVISSSSNFRFYFANNFVIASGAMSTIWTTATYQWNESNQKYYYIGIA